MRCHSPYSPLVLPQPTWPEPANAASGRGLQFLDPSIGTGRVQTYEDSRTAVQVAEDQQDSELAGSAATPAGLENLPDALQGLNYRIDFGVEYRF